MMTTACQLLYDFIYHTTKSNSEEANKILELLKAETSQSFDDNINIWTEWFLSGSFEAHEKNFIKTANRLYKVHLKLKSNNT